jgi:hypothetical protein
MLINKQTGKLLPALIIILMSVAGCKSIREARKETTPATMSPDMMVRTMHNNQLQYDWFSARFSGSVLFDNNTNNVSGNIRIERDKAIYISIAPVLGIEIVRALITPDSVKIVNRLESTYYLGGIAVLNNMFNADVDFYMLQALFTGNDFPHFQSDRFNLSEERGLLKLQNNSRKRLSGGGSALNQAMWIDAETLKIKSNIITEERQGRSLRADYRRHEKIDQQWAPAEVQIFASDGSENANMNLTYSRITINEPQRMQFSVPARYTRISL